MQPLSHFSIVFPNSIFFPPPHVIHVSLNIFNYVCSLVQISNCSLLHLKALDFPLKFLAPDYLLISAALFTQGCVIARS